MSVSYKVFKNIIFSYDTDGYVLKTGLANQAENKFSHKRTRLSTKNGKMRTNKYQIVRVRMHLLNDIPKYKIIVCNHFPCLCAFFLHKQFKKIINKLRTEKRNADPCQIASTYDDLRELSTNYKKGFYHVCPSFSNKQN